MRGVVVVHSRGTAYAEGRGRVGIGQRGEAGKRKRII
jgi:hypothetical protein